MVDDIQDMEIDEDFDIYLDEGNDIATTDPEDTPLQSVFIHVKNAVQSRIGDAATENNLQSLATDVTEGITNVDPQIESVESVEVEYDGGNKVEVDVQFLFNQSYETVTVVEAI